jgi:hypothetical protein
MCKKCTLLRKSVPLLHLYVRKSVGAYCILSANTMQLCIVTAYRMQAVTFCHQLVSFRYRLYTHLITIPHEPLRIPEGLCKDRLHDSWHTLHVTPKVNCVKVSYGKAYECGTTLRADWDFADCAAGGCTKSAIRYGMCMLSLQICTRQYHIGRYSTGIMLVE